MPSLKQMSNIKKPMKRLSTSNGFTILELMITIAVIAILTGVAIPSFNITLKNNRLVNKSNDIVTAMNFARQTAIGRGVVTFVCHSNNADTSTPTCDGGSSSDWNTGVIIYSAPARTIVTGERDYVDGSDVLVQQFDFNDDDEITITQADNNDYVSFRSNGLLFDDSDELIFTVCDNRTGETGRMVRVSIAGKISTQETTCT